MSDIHATLLKLRDMARMGTEHESRAAFLKMEELAEKYGIDLSTLEKDKKCHVYFSYQTKHEKSLLLHLYGKLGYAEDGGVRFFDAARRRGLYFEMTFADGVRLRHYYVVCRRALRKVIESAVEAFILKNDLLPANRGTTRKSRMSQEELHRMACMMAAVDPVALHVPLGEGGPDTDDGGR